MHFLLLGIRIISRPKSLICNGEWGEDEDGDHGLHRIFEKLMLSYKRIIESCKVNQWK